MSKYDEALRLVRSGRYDFEEYADTFIEALEYANKHMKHTYINTEWIDLRKKTPPKHHRVLLLTSRNEIVIGALTDVYGSHLNPVYKWTPYTKTPIAWMPLPEKNFKG